MKYDLKPEREVQILYRNWRGETRERRIQPIGLSFGNNRWHPEVQWIMTATDLEDGILKGFALSGILRWGPVPEPAVQELAPAFRAAIETGGGLL